MRRAVGLGAINKKKLAEVMNLCYVSKPNVSLWGSKPSVTAINVTLTL